MSDEYDLVMSPLCQDIESEGHAVRVEIYGDGKTGWILEVVDEFNNSTVWDDAFLSDQLALKEAIRTIEEEGITSLIGPQSNSTAIH